MNQFLKSLLPAVLSVLLAITITGCGTGAENAKPEGAVKIIDTIRIGLAPDEDAAAVLKKYGPFIQYLSKATGMKVEPYIGPDYTATIEAMNAGHLDVAWFGPSEYVLAAEVVKNGVEAFAAAIQAEGTLAYKTSFIVRADAGINTLEDMKGKTLAFTDPASTSGHIFGRYSLVQRGHKPEDFFRQVIYSGSHDAGLLAVKNKQVDIAAVSSRKVPGFIKSGLISKDDIKIVFESVEIPADPITYRKDLPWEIKDKIKAAFLKNTPELAASLEGTGFAKFGGADDKAYDLVREAYKTAGLKPEL
ncbi:phosphate/phosphite/phosphonate ABC transporter substrate-binding protein [Acetonema longum]|nr:phosphate/phosphite/phosphonate ABC transporter substrate-binding protein [Acetonema longum]